MQAHTRTAIERQAYSLGAACSDTEDGGIELQLAGVVARFEEVDDDLIALCTLVGSRAIEPPNEQGDESDPVRWIDPDATRWLLNLDAASGRVTCRAHRSLDTTSMAGTAARVQHVVDVFMRFCDLWHSLNASLPALTPHIEMVLP
jgi:hypothetical protein